MNIKTIAAVALTGLVIAGCGKQEQEEADKAVIAIGETKLMQSQVDADVEKIIKSQGDRIPAEQREYAKQMTRNQVVQGFVMENVLVSKAKAAGFTITDADRKQRIDEFLKAVKNQPDAPKSFEDFLAKYPLGAERARQQFENGILIDKMIKAEQAKQPKKDYAMEAKKIIDGIVSNNNQVASAEAGALKKIKDLKAQLDKVPAAEVAKKFAELAKANSACPSSAKGGDLGEFTHGQMVKEFDEVAFKLPVNKVSEPVKTQFGYHLILTTKKTPAVAAKGDKPAEPEKVQASHILIKAGEKRDVPKAEDVIKRLQQNAERQFVQGFVMGLVKKANIKAFSEEYKQFEAKDESPVETAPKK